MKIDRAVKVGIVSSVLATILFIYLLDPAFRLFGSVVARISRVVFSSYFDSLFARCAVDQEAVPSFALLAALTGLMWGLPFGALAYLRGERQAEKKLKEGPSAYEAWRLRTNKRLLPLIVICLLAVLCLQLEETWSIYFCLRTKTSFRQHMRAIGPYLAQGDEGALLSKWAQMRSRSEYDAIYVRIREVASKNGVFLMPNPAYNVWR